MTPAVHQAKAPEATRFRILKAAFAEFYRNSFQGGSLNRVVTASGMTKGAMFHHFEGGKQELGYAVVDEVIGPLLEARWLEPLRHTNDPVAPLKEAFRKYIREDIETGSWTLGCPLNNLAQEMSPLDEGFRQRIDGLYASWRGVIAAAIRRGIDAGKVATTIEPEQVAAFVVVAQMGIWGSGKSSRSEELMVQSGEALCAYLDTLEP